MYFNETSYTAATYLTPWASEGGQEGLAPLDFEMFSKRRLFS